MSRGLKALEHIGNYHIGEKKYGYDIKETAIYGIVEKELKDYEEMKHSFNIITCENGDLLKYKQALEIIKETFKITFDNEEQTIGIDNVYFLTFNDKTKYDLLKEVLLCPKN